MKQVDKTKPVLVTGANGYVASWLVKKLLDEGIHVHAAVRNPNDDRKVGHLKRLAAESKGSITFFKSDLLVEGSYREAMEGCELVYHTASPFTSNFNNAQRDLIDPAVKGTENVLNTASEVSSVIRVVVTSSCAAMYSDAIDTLSEPSGRLTENSWNKTASLKYQPYSYSKMLAERKAWEIANAQDKWDLVAINMSLVMGPPLNPTETTSESFSIMKQMGDGRLRLGAPRLAIGIVDVRDVAEAHYLAGFKPEANGRYITSAHETTIYDVAMELVPKYGKDFPLPSFAAPSWLVLLMGPLLNKNLTRRYIRNNIDMPWRADTGKIKKELGIHFRSLRETMEDSFQSLIDAGVLKKS